MKFFKIFKKINLLLALAFLFAICFQSAHIFLDEEHHHFHTTTAQEKTSKTHISQHISDDCPVCEFKFAVYLQSEIFSVQLFQPSHKFHYSTTFTSFLPEKEFLFFSHRGPPFV